MHRKKSFPKWVCESAAIKVAKSNLTMTQCLQAAGCYDSLLSLSTDGTIKDASSQPCLNSKLKQWSKTWNILNCICLSKTNWQFKTGFQKFWTVGLVQNFCLRDQGWKIKIDSLENQVRFTCRQLLVNWRKKIKCKWRQPLWNISWRDRNMSSAIAS